MRELRLFAALSGFAQRVYYIAGVGLIFLLLSMMPAHADDATIPLVQDVTLVSTSDSSTVVSVSSVLTAPQSAESQPSTQQQTTQESPTGISNPIPSATSIETKVHNATVALDNAIESATATIQIIPNVQAVVAASPEATQAVESATVCINTANTAIAAAESATATAIVAQQAVESQTAVVATATTVVESATVTVNSATNAVITQTGVVTIATTNLTNAKSTLTALQNTPSDSTTYTTEGYVAPVAPETTTVTTTTLPVMWDAATKIQTPFDIKLGNTVYEGQGTNSQIYVTSKATITFGTGDFNWSDFPAGPHISVFGSDFMSAGPDAGITVTTTETTLAVDWDLHRFGDNNGPLTNVNWTMTVNPTTGEWTGIGTAAGNRTTLWGGPRIGVREAAGQAVTPMTNVTNTELTSQIESQTAVVQSKAEIKTNAVATLATLTTAKQTAVTALTTAQTTLTTETQVLTSLQETATATITTANTLADTAVTKVNEAVTALNVAVTTVRDTYAQQQAAAAEAAAAAAATEAAAAAYVPPAPPAPFEPPAEEPPAEEPPAEEPPAEEPPAEEPPAEEPPAEEPPAEEPPAEEPPAEEPPAEEPPAEEPPAEEPPAEEPPAEEPPAEEPPAVEEEPTVEEAVKDALEDGKLSNEEKAVVAEALIAAVAPGEAVSAQDMRAAGLEYKDLPPATPVDVRTDESGNAVVITAEVAAQVELVQDPAALLATAFTDPGAALAALGSIGADMSPEEREEATDMVVATVVAAGAAMNAVGAAAGAAGGSTGGSTGGGGSSGGGGASGDSKGVRRRPQP